MLDVLHKDGTIGTNIWVVHLIWKGKNIIFKKGSLILFNEF